MHGKDDMVGSWCILRTSAAGTLALAQSLKDVGYAVWAPLEMRERLAGPKREKVEQAVAILPGYVFAAMDRLPDLLALSRSPSLNYRIWDADQRKMITKGHPYFSVFRMHGCVRPQSEQSLAPLRALEASLMMLAEIRRGHAERRRLQSLHKGPPPRFMAGSLVYVGGGGFAGLRLVVAEDSDGKDVKLIHPDWTWPIEISAWKLNEIQLENGLPEPAAAIAA